MDSGHETKEEENDFFKNQLSIFIEAFHLWLQHEILQCETQLILIFENVTNQLPVVLSAVSGNMYKFYRESDHPLPVSRGNTVEGMFYLFIISQSENTHNMIYVQTPTTKISIFLYHFGKTWLPEHVHAGVHAAVCHVTLYHLKCACADCSPSQQPSLSGLFWDESQHNTKTSSKHTP